MRCLNRIIFFFVAVAVLTVMQILVAIIQTTQNIHPERRQFTSVLQTYTELPVSSTVNTSGQYNCDQEYNTLLGLPESLRNCTMCQTYTCKEFLFKESNKVALAQVKSYMKSHPKIIIPDQHYIDLAKDCDNFKKVRGYHLSPMNDEEAEYPLAFNILIHKDLEHVEMLLASIYRPQNVYCIHSDANSPQTFRDAIKAITNCFDNVFIASKIEHIVYAGFSRLQADINCMRDLAQSKVEWKYLWNLAGQSFPLMTNSELVKIAKIYNGVNDIEGMTRRVLHGRIDNEWQEQNGIKLNKTGRKNPKPPHDIEIVRGSAYGVFTREFVEFILTDQKAKDLLDWSRTTYSPDEHYWATLHHTYSNPHLHTPGGYSGYPDSKPWLAVYAAWGGRDKCDGMWKRGVCIFGVGDLPGLLKRHEMFANKFHLEFQPVGLECMQKWIEYKTRCPLPFDAKYYQDLPFIPSKWKLW